MTGLDPVIHAVPFARCFIFGLRRHVDTRVKPAHDDLEEDKSLATLTKNGTGMRE
jgi:hypothetical protein